MAKRKKFTQELYDEAIKLHLGNTPIEHYGVWVFYPWSNRLVHLLDEAEFIEVRTNRNIYKNYSWKNGTHSKLKKVGLIGLSVGQIGIGYNGYGTQF